WPGAPLYPTGMNRSFCPSPFGLNTFRISITPASITRTTERTASTQPPEVVTTSITGSSPAPAGNVAFHAAALAPAASPAPRSHHEEMIPDPEPVNSTTGSSARAGLGDAMIPPFTGG